MKWIVNLDFDFGSFEPNFIGFKPVYEGDCEYSCAYETKAEALKAFCKGQVTMYAFIAEQKEAVPKGEQKYGDNFLPPKGYINGKERNIMERLAKIEERLTEIEGVLTSIGSPKGDLRKKVKWLDKMVKGLEGRINDWFYEYKWKFSARDREALELAKKVEELEKRLRNK